jgi:hypothetical protein
MIYPEDAFEWGKSAYDDGLGEGSCPFPQGSELQGIWLDGYYKSRGNIILLPLLIFLFIVGFVAFNYISAKTPRYVYNNNATTLVSNIVVVPPSGYGIRLSHYRPQDGGTNCDHDCSTMASGDNTWSWQGGKNGVYAAACPREWGWHTGKLFVLLGYTFECRDTGGWIVCLDVGEYDKAIANAHGKGHLLSEPVYAEQPYCWVDTLTDNPLLPYGTMTHNWKFS